jgi:hypothetical protein
MVLDYLFTVIDVNTNFCLARRPRAAEALAEAQALA